jgi:hypothetical protein
MEQRPAEPRGEEPTPREQPREQPRDRIEMAREQPRDRTEMTRERDRTEPARNRTEPMPDRDAVWPNMADFRRRFDEIQVQFVEEPEAAVKKAEELLNQFVDQMANAMHERLRSIHGELGDGNSDTERLRLAMQRLRRMIDSFGERAAA